MTLAVPVSDEERNRPRLSASLSTPNLERLRAIAEDRGKPVSRVLDDLLTSQFLDEDRVVGRLSGETIIRMVRARDAVHNAVAGELVAPGDVLALIWVLLEFEEVRA